MRMPIFVLMMALFLVAPGQPTFAQTQSGQGDSSAAQSGAKQGASSQTAQPLSASAMPAKTKTESKPIVLTNENVGDAIATKPAQSAQPATPNIAQSAQSDAKPAQKQSASAPAKQTDAQTATPATGAKPKLQLKPHTLLTEDNLQSFIGTKGVNVVGNGLDIDALFDCDMNCYNQARSSAGVYPGNDLGWMRDLHSGIEDLQKDSKWMAFLVNLANIRSQYCKLAAEESGELQRVDNYNNVTDAQINIREDYNRKLAALNEETTAAYQRLTPLQAGYSALTKSFMYMQELRVMQSSCAPPQRNRYNYDPDDPEE